MITGGGAGEPGAAGGLARHIPVLVHQVVEQLNVRDNTLIIDGTFGAGGYTREILGAANCNVGATRLRLDANTWYFYSDFVSDVFHQTGFGSVVIRRPHSSPCGASASRRNRGRKGRPSATT